MAFLFQFDQFLQSSIAQLQNPFFDMIAVFLEVIGGDLRIYTIIIVLLLIGKKTRRFALLFLISVVTATLLISIIKVMVGRPRPFVANQIATLLEVSRDEYYVSFPSAHASAAAVIVVSYWLTYRKYYLVGTLVILIMAWSRIYLHMHYPLDTLVGGGIGIAITYIVYFSMKKLQNFYQKRSV